MTPETKAKYIKATMELVSTLSYDRFMPVDEQAFCQRHDLKMSFFTALRDLDALEYDLLEGRGYKQLPALAKLEPEMIVSQMKASGRRKELQQIENLVTTPIGDLGGVKVRSVYPNKNDLNERFDYIVPHEPQAEPSPAITVTATDENGESATHTFTPDPALVTTVVEPEPTGRTADNEQPQPAKDHFPVWDWTIDASAETPSLESAVLSGVARTIDERMTNDQDAPAESETEPATATTADLKDPFDVRIRSQGFKLKMSIWDMQYVTLLQSIVHSLSARQ